MTAPGDNMAAEGGGYPEPCGYGEHPDCTGRAEYRMPESGVWGRCDACEPCAWTLAIVEMADALDFVGDDDRNAWHEAEADDDHEPDVDSITEWEHVEGPAWLDRDEEGDW